jgi:hypothetical protein
MKLGMIMANVYITFVIYGLIDKKIKQMGGIYHGKNERESKVQSYINES